MLNRVSVNQFIMLSKIFYNGTIVWGHSKMEKHFSWWRNQMETFSALPAFCEGISGGFPSQKPMTRNFDVFFDLRLNKRLSKQSRRWWFETPSRSLLSHCNVDPNGDLSPTEHMFLVWFRTILCHRTWSALVQVMPSCLMAPIAITWSNIDLPSTWSSGFHSKKMFTWIRLKFVKGSHYISGAQCTNLGSGFVACLQMPWFLTPPEHK